MAKYYIPLGINNPYEHTEEEGFPACAYEAGLVDLICNLAEIGNPAVRTAELPDGGSKIMVGVEIFIPTEIVEDMGKGDSIVIGIREKKGGDN